MKKWCEEKGVEKQAVGNLNPKLGFLKRILHLVGCGCGEDGNDDIPPPGGGWQP